jgi:hypothetical protein
MVIAGGSGKWAKYARPLHWYRGVCANKLFILRDRLEEQLLAALAKNLLVPEMLDRTLTSFSEQLEARLQEVHDAASKFAESETELRSELTGLRSQAEKIVDAISLHGFSEALSARLLAVEIRSKEISVILDSPRELQQVGFSNEEIREFVLRKAEDFVSALKGDPHSVKEALRRHIKELVLTPKETATGSVFEVTGDLDLLGGASNVMLNKSLEGIAQHYSLPRIVLANVVLDPSLPLAA